MKGKKEPDLVAGIDPGTTGGCAILSRFSGDVIAWFPLPMHKTARGNEVDVKETWTQLTTNTGHKPFSLVIEDVAEHLPQSKTMRSMAYCVGKLAAMAEMKGSKPTLILPRVWQKSLLGKVAKGKTKQRAKELAEACWPEESFTDEKGKYLDGCVDAALLACYYLFLFPRKNPLQDSVNYVNSHT